MCRIFLETNTLIMNEKLAQQGGKFMLVRQLEGRYSLGLTGFRVGRNISVALLPFLFCVTTSAMRTGSTVLCVWTGHTFGISQNGTIRQVQYVSCRQYVPPMRYEMRRAIRVDGAVCCPPYWVISYRSYNTTSSFSVNPCSGDNPIRNTFWSTKYLGNCSTVSLYYVL